MSVKFRSKMEITIKSVLCSTFASQSKVFLVACVIIGLIYCDFCYGLNCIPLRMEVSKGDGLQSGRHLILQNVCEILSR